jgi:hypothetical protein
VKDRINDLKISEHLASSHCWAFEGAIDGRQLRLCRPTRHEKARSGWFAETVDHRAVAAFEPRLNRTIEAPGTELAAIFTSDETAHQACCRGAIYPIQCDLNVDRVAAKRCQ